MFAGKTDEIIKLLKKAAFLEKLASINLNTIHHTGAKEMALKLERSSLENLELAETLKVLSRLDLLSVYTVNMTKTVNRGEIKTYTYWYASWRVEKKVRNVYLGSIAKMSHKEALNKARNLKANDLNLKIR